MQFDNYEGLEFVRPTAAGRRGYWRRIPDRYNITIKQKAARKNFGKVARTTRGMRGTVVLPDGRRISKSAYQIMIRNQKPLAPERIAIKLTGVPNRVLMDIELPAQNRIPWIKEMIELVQAKMVVKGVHEGTIPREVGLLWLLERIYP